MITPQIITFLVDLDIVKLLDHIKGKNLKVTDFVDVFYPLYYEYSTYIPVPPDCQATDKLSINRSDIIPIGRYVQYGKRYKSAARALVIDGSSNIIGSSFDRQHVQLYRENPIFTLVLPAHINENHDPTVVDIKQVDLTNDDLVIAGCFLTPFADNPDVYKSFFNNGCKW